MSCGTNGGKVVMNIHNLQDGLCAAAGVKSVKIDCEAKALIVETQDEGGNLSSESMPLCPDLFMTVVDNEDGTITATNVDGVEVDWCKSPTLLEGLGIDFSGQACNPSDPLVISLDLCELSVLTEAEVEAAGIIHLAACVDGNTVKIPYPTQQQINMCINTISSFPVNPPSEGELPIKYLCDGSLAVYLCDGTGWKQVYMSFEELEALDPSDVENICTSLNFPVGYDLTDDCPKHKNITLEQLVEEFQKCLCANIPKSTTPTKTALNCIDGVLTEQPIECCDNLRFGNQGMGGGYCVEVTPTSEDIIIQNRDISIIQGSGTASPVSSFSGLYHKMTVTNTFDDKALVTFYWTAFAMATNVSDAYTAEEYAAIIASDTLDIDFLAIDSGVISPGEGVFYAQPQTDLGIIKIPDVETGSFDNNSITRRAGTTKLITYAELEPGQSTTSYCQAWYGAKILEGFDGFIAYHIPLYGSYKLQRGLV